MKLTADQLTLAGINERALLGFGVPDFQRNYSWMDPEIKQFWIDLKAVLDGQSRDHFFGPIVVLETDRGRTPLVDGQQRITTLMILASVVRDYLIDELNNPFLEINGSTFFISQNFTKILFLNDLTTSRIQSNYQIAKIFEEYIVRNPNTSERKHFSTVPSNLNKQEKRVSKNVESAQILLKRSFVEWIGNYPSVESKKEAIQHLAETISNRIHFLYIEVGNEEDAFTIFETLNDRGLKLSAGDLIKSYLLRRITEQNTAIARDSIIELWEKIPANLEDYDVSSFLRHYLLTQQDIPIQKKRIFGILKSDVEEQSRQDPQSAKKKLDEIAGSSFHYGRLLGVESISEDNSEIQRRLGLLAMVGDSYRVFLLRVLQLGYVEDDLLLAIRSVEKIAFRWAICGENAQELETKFQKLAHKLVANSPESLRQVCLEMISEAPSDEIFASAFIAKSSRDTKMQAYVMRSLCFGITGSDVTTVRREVSVEHIAPQKPRGTFWFDSVAPLEGGPEDGNYEDYVYKWGNITILERKLNSTVRDGDWNLKKNGDGVKLSYKDSSIEVTKHLLGAAIWTKASIDHRTQWIAAQALIYWKKELPNSAVANLQRYQPNT